MAKGSTEFFTQTPGGPKEDALLHADILRDTEGEARADMEAVAAAVADGMPIAQAAGMYAGGGARVALRRAGLL